MVKKKPKVIQRFSINFKYNVGVVIDKWDFPLKKYLEAESSF